MKIQNFFEDMAAIKGMPSGHARPRGPADEDRQLRTKISQMRDHYDTLDHNPSSSSGAQALVDYFQNVKRVDDRLATIVGKKALRDRLYRLRSEYMEMPKNQKTDAGRKLLQVYRTELDKLLTDVREGVDQNLIHAAIDDVTNLIENLSEEQYANAQQLHEMTATIHVNNQRALHVVQQLYATFEQQG